MIKLHFESTHEFEKLFSSKNKEVTDGIVSGVENAMDRNKKVAFLFEVTFSNGDHAYEITLSSHLWAEALQSCLDFYHEEGHTDEAIDCWKLLECAKVW